MMANCEQPQRQFFVHAYLYSFVHALIYINAISFIVCYRYLYVFVQQIVFR